ncbi:MAG: hydantoinase/oxoprolinase family protein [Thermoleophilia bacterium]|nr:hydantoinase/oxoprolinase family protein [Thermoleophilia bacterium]
MKPVLLGVDVGGTFTDAVLVSGGRLFRTKLLTTADQSDAVMAAARRLLEKAGLSPADITGFSHGMTTATNALLERKGALTASVTTAGFRDLLEIGRQNRPRLYDLCPSRPEPLVPQELRFVVDERVAPEGVITPLPSSEMERLVAELRELVEVGEADGVRRPGEPESVPLESIAICLLFSFRDPSHEKVLADMLRRGIPGVHVSVSSEVLPQFREYERFSTTAVDAYLTPVVTRYLERLGAEAADAGLPSPAIMQSSGGVVPLEQAAASAAPLLLSGPAAGVMGAIFTGDRSDIENLIAFDMGGTSTDVTLVRDGAAETTTGREIGGSPVALPMVDIHTIGAGGGSIAWIDAGGALRVGPASAGAEPGPACYGKGGDQATVTDANLFLGYLGERLGDEGLVLDRDRAVEALANLAGKLRMTMEETAMGIRRVANSEMVKALRVISVERGHDPRGFVLMAFGGAGPMHGADLASELDISRVLLPESCGVLSALGMVVGDQRRDWVKTVFTSGAWDDSFLEEEFAELERDAAIAASRLIRRADLRYRGQSHELTVELDEDFSAAGLAERFELEHERAYGYRAEGESVELVNIRLTALTPLERPQIGKEAVGGGIPSIRNAFFDGAWIETQAWQRSALGTTEITGPAVIEEEEATTVVPPGWKARLDEAGNLWLEAGS